ncbi:MAG: hypothetical protein AAB568_00065 [Patescibacteria group bacterium]
MRTFISAGRVMFTFARRKKGKTVYQGFHGEEIARLPYREDSVSFVGEDGDPLCLSAGIQSVHADLKTALDIIEDVIKHWPADAQKQAKLYKASSDVSIL